jgi:hypothetical protein|tara:strand:- start:45 stop:1172 length:1128 start_codon:yes stop_codon:yes gene_type:complete
MDKELYDLKNWAIETLKEYEAELLVRKQVTGKPPSELKKVKRFLSALAVDTSGTYADMLDDARRRGISQKELALMGRNMEERIMNSFRVLPDDPAHHMYSLRTAGDLVQNVEPGIREMGLQILRDEGYILGNTRQNLTSLAEALHQGRTGKGAELAALGEVKIDKTKTDIAHPRGTGDPLISRTIDYKTIKTPEDFANAYRPLLEQQKADLAKVLTPGGPEDTRRQIIAEDVLQKGGPDDIFDLKRSPVEVKAGRDLIKKAPGVMQRAYQSMGMKLNFVGGKAMLNVLPAGLIPVVGGGFDVLEAKEKTEKAIETQNPIDKAQAAIANVTAATAFVPEPITQGVNFVGGTVNFVIDAIRTPGKPVTDEDLEFSTL